MWGRGGYLGTDNAPATPRPRTALGCGNWQWPLRNHLLPWDCRERSQLLLSAPACVSCSWVWACEETVAGGKGISEVPLECLELGIKCAGQLGSLLLLCQRGGRRGIEHNRESALVVADTGNKWQRGGNQVWWRIFLIILVVTVLGNLH